ncbi:MAG: hypothetical protein HWN68_05950 [Desulfobacterales bacterium]|nr:hypothetical protein [Desulfobacterales bacterium]
MDKKNDQVCVQCDCGGHYLVVTYFGPWEKEPPIAYLTVKRSRLGLWLRLKEAVSLVLDRERLWDEYSFESFNQIEKLDKMVKKIKKNLKEWEKLNARPQD